MFVPSGKILYSDPLREGVKIGNTNFDNLGVCLDPTNNGFVMYVPLATLENATNYHNPNVVFLKLNSSIDKNTAISQLKSMVQTVDPAFDVYSLGSTVDGNLNFLDSTWSTVMFLPLFTLASASICLVSYMMLSAEEQHQEFGILRAVGARPGIVVSALAIQSLLLLIPSFAVGLSFGTIITFMVLMQHPLFTVFTVLEISVWFAVALAVMFVFSLYPAFKLSKAPVLRIMH
jgi:ABC-type antimicrobial peptide transport system permease subunit